MLSFFAALMQIIHKKTAIANVTKNSDYEAWYCTPDSIDSTVLARKKYVDEELWWLDAPLCMPCSSLDIRPLTLHFFFKFFYFLFVCLFEWWWFDAPVHAVQQFRCPPFDIAGEIMANIKYRSPTHLLIDSFICLAKYQIQQFSNLIILACFFMFNRCLFIRILAKTYHHIST